MNGTLLGERFVLEREIGSGGMARVFLGKDTVLDRPVAVKILNPGHDETDIGSRFRREGRTAARLSHPNIVQVYDAGEAELAGRKVSYIVMEYVSGGDLKGMIDKEGTLSEKHLAHLGAGAAAGLSHAHERGVIHRDVKPHNVLIDAYGEPKLTDFGIARALDNTTSHATRTGAYLGTALYSAPEQLQGQGVTPKSDVYSLGVTLYQAAVGEAPFVGTPIEVAGQHIHQPPVAPKANGFPVGERIEGLILACLSKDPELRPTAAEVHDRLREESSQIRERATAQAAPPVPEPQPTRQNRPAPTAALVQERSQRRRRGPLLLGAAALLLVLLGIAAFAAYRGNEAPSTASSPPQENREAEPRAQNAREEPPLEESTAPAAEPETQPQEQQEPQQQQARQPETPPAVNEPVNNNPEEPVGLTEEAAAQTVEQVYESSDAGDFETSYDLLSQNFQQNTAGSFDNWVATFDTLESLRFIEGPNAQVFGDTATVTGVTIAQITDGTTERNTGTWTLVNEGGEWKLDDLSLDQQLI